MLDLTPEERILLMELLRGQIDRGPLRIRSYTFDQARQEERTRLIRGLIEKLKQDAAPTGGSTQSPADKPTLS